MGDRFGVMICGHGSRDPQAVKEFAVLSEKLTGRFGDWPVDYGYLEFARPVIRDGLDRLRERQVNRVLAVPGMLFAAGHAKNDIPSVLNTYQAGHDGLTISYGRELGIDTEAWCAQPGSAFSEALAAAGDHVPRHDTVLVVVGRGASDPDANSNVAKVMRMLWEGMGFGWGETAYSGVTFPLVEPGPGACGAPGLPPRGRVPLFPVHRECWCNASMTTPMLVAARHPDIEFVKAPYLNDHPLVLETFVRTRARDPGGHRQHELPDVQVPRTGAGLRSRGRSGAGKPSSSRRRHRHRRDCDLLPSPRS